MPMQPPYGWLDNKQPLPSGLVDVECVKTSPNLSWLENMKWKRSESGVLDRDE